MFRSVTLVSSLASSARTTATATRSAMHAVRRLPSVRHVSDSSSSSSGSNGPNKSNGSATKAQSTGEAAVRPSAVVKDNELVLEGTSTEILSAPIAAPASTAAASLSHSADLSLFLQSLSNARTPSATTAASPTPSHRPTGPALPLFAPDHPLMTDDFGVLPPFASPTSLATTFGHLTISSAEAEAQLAQGERQAMTRLIGHPAMPYILTPGNPLLPSAANRGRPRDAAELFAAEEEMETAEEGQEGSQERIITMQVMSPPGTTSPASIMGLLPEGATLVRMRAEQAQMSEATKYWMTSVLRKRRKKMNKHKLRKLRKKTRSQRK